MLTLAQDPYSTNFKARWQAGEVDEREYHVIDTNAYKTTVLLRTPAYIDQSLHSYTVLHCTVIDKSSFPSGSSNTYIGTNYINS